MLGCSINGARMVAILATARARFNENRVFLIAFALDKPCICSSLPARGGVNGWVSAARNNFFAAGTSAELSPCAVDLLNGDRQLRIAC